MKKLMINVFLLSVISLSVLGTSLTPLSQASILASTLLSDSQVKDQISNVLKLKHPPASSTSLGGADWWRDLSQKNKRVSDIIIEMYSKTDLRNEKLQLIGALAYFPNDSEVATFLKKESKNSNPSTREAAIRSLGMSQGMVEHEFLAKQLSSKDDRTRMAAAQALSEIDDPRATSSVDQFLTQEKRGWIVSNIKNFRLEQRAKISRQNSLAVPASGKPKSKAAKSESETIRVNPLKRNQY